MPDSKSEADPEVIEATHCHRNIELRSQKAMGGQILARDELRKETRIFAPVVSMESEHLKIEP